MPKLEVGSIQDIDLARKRIRLAATRAYRAMSDLIAREDDPLEVLRAMKFTELGRHPTEERSLNLVEQLHQTFTYLVSLEAARWIWQHHTDVGPLTLNLGTGSGFDVCTEPSTFIAAEVFTAVTPSNNGKLKKDIARLQKDATGYMHRYVFMACPGLHGGRQAELEPKDGEVTVEVWNLSLDHLVKGSP